MPGQAHAKPYSYDLHQKAIQAIQEIIIFIMSTNLKPVIIITLLLKYVKTRPGAKVLSTSCVPGEGSPEEFYKKMGFTSTDEMDEDGELIMQFEL